MKAHNPILVSGLINIETTLRVDGFPLPYFPVRYPFGGVRSTVSGVGFNAALALHTLGDRVRLVSLVGKDFLGKQVVAELGAAGLGTDFIFPQVEETAQSVILYDGEGKRQIHVDLKDVQQQGVPSAALDEALKGCSLAVLCNINFSRPFLQRARCAGVMVATDVHAIADLRDDYNQEFIRAADVLFLSDENLPCPAEEWVRALQSRCQAEIIVVGLGSQGALLAVRRDGFLGRYPAVSLRPVISTIGAGDALFACFLHFYHPNGDPYAALQQAILFASYKIGSTGAAEGFLSEPELARIAQEAASER